MIKLSKEAAQLVFDEISKPRGPSDRISAVIQMCLRAGAELPGAEPAPEPEPEPEEVSEPEDNASGEGDVTLDDD